MPVVASSVPIPLTPLVGRSAVLDRIQDRLERHRLVTITGLGGAGKTRLAIETARRLADATAPITFIDLSSATDRPAALGLLATSLDALETAERGVDAAILSRLARTGPSTLVLDNLEQLSGAGALVSWLLGQTPDLRVLATSRRRLGIDGEAEVAVEPLGVPDHDTPAELAASEAGRLFLARAHEIGRLEQLTDDEATAVSRLCRRLDGLPLALELAAARLRILSPQAMLDRLDAGGLLLSADPARSLDAVLRWTVGLLTPDQHALLAAVSVCAGGFDLAMAEALAPGVATLDALDVLASLALVRVEPTDAGELRFRLLETVRGFATELLDKHAAGEARRAHAARILAIVEMERPRLRGRHAAVARGRLRAEQENIEAALDWAEANDPATGIAIAAGLRDFWLQFGQFRLPCERLGRMLAARPTRDGIRARGLFAFVWLDRERTGWIDGPALEEAAALAHDAGDLATEVQALELLSVLQAFLGVEEAGLDVTVARLEALRALTPDPMVAAYALATAGLRAIIRGDPAALDLNIRAAELSASVGDLIDEGGFLLNGAMSAIGVGNTHGAFVASSRALEAFREVGMRSGLSPALGLVGATSALLGRLDVSRSALLEALDVAIEFDSPLRLAEVLRAAMSYGLAIGDGALVGRLWGASMRVTEDANGITEIPDRALGEAQLAAARRGGNAVAVEVGLHEGMEADPATSVAELRRRLEAPPTVQRREPRMRHADLTAREVEVLALVAAGQSDAEIAEALFISAKTASVHVSNAKAKLGAATRLELALKARELLAGEVSPREADRRGRGL